MRSWASTQHSHDHVAPHSQFMDSMQLDPETVDNLDTYNHIPPQLMEKCAALSVRPDTVRNLVQSMQGEDRKANRWKGSSDNPGLSASFPGRVKGTSLCLIHTYPLTIPRSLHSDSALGFEA